MPRIKWHVRKKQHDLDTNSLLAKHSPNYFDWEVITLFYSTMHHVDAAICKKRSTGTAIPEPQNHKQRRKLIVKHFRPIASDYKMLDVLSQWARYQEVVITPNIVSTAKSLHSKVVAYLQNYVP